MDEALLKLTLNMQLSTKRMKYDHINKIPFVDEFFQHQENDHNGKTKYMQEIDDSNQPYHMNEYMFMKSSHQ
jgi:hypothetical protein